MSGARGVPRKAAITNANAATFTAKEIAVLANTTAKRMRSFIRAQAEQGNEIVAPVGSGARYAFTANEAHALVQAFNVRRISAGAPVTRSADELRMLLADALADEANGDEAVALVHEDEDEDGDDAHAMSDALAEMREDGIAE